MGFRPVLSGEPCPTPGLVILKDLRERWATLDSAKLNNALQENWHVKPDSTSEWSHCPMIPLYITTMSLAGIHPLVPGFRRCEIRPLVADLDALERVVKGVRGPIEFSSRGRPGSRDLRRSQPPGCEGEFVADGRETLELKRLQGSERPARLA
jgi:alpha-L-rhamnosidase